MNLTSISYTALSNKRKELSINSLCNVIDLVEKETFFFTEEFQLKSMERMIGLENIYLKPLK